MRKTFSIATLAVAAATTAAGCGAQDTAAVTARQQAAAAEIRPVGFAGMNGGTTGGAGGSTVTVTSASQLKQAAGGTGKTTILIKSAISVSGMLPVGSNKTLLGVGAAGKITGGGLNLNRSKNVIIRNLTFSGSKDDAINVQSGSTNIWIDHNDLSKAFDGLVDIKRGSDFVTVSWNLFHDHNKSALLGHSDGNGSQDKGHLRVTYVHNWFKGTTQRHPRVRFANPVHVLNNYYSNTGSYGVASTMNAGVLVERNFFENVKRPTSLAEGTSAQGNIKQVANHLVGSGAIVTRNPGAVAAIPYAYAAEAGAKVKATVTAGAGVGKI